MTEQNISEELRLKTTDETRNCLIKHINQNELISKKTHTSLHNFKLYWTFSYYSFCND